MTLIVSGQKLLRWRQQAQKAALKAGVSIKEVDWLLQEATGLDSLVLRLESLTTRPQIELKMPLSVLDQLWQQRINELVPVQYLIGVAPWRHFSLNVTPDVLIPRPETEELIDIAVAAAKDQQRLEQGHWVDLGTGSGAIALGLAEAFPQATIHAVDSSAAAAEVAQQNVKNLGLSNRINIYQGSWWEPLEALKAQVSGMVSNPPYIPTALVPKLQPEVALHEPHSALDGGKDGLECIRYLITTSPDYLRSGGVWLIEMMAGQAEAVAQLLQQQGSYSKIQIYPDLAGIERFALAYRS